MPPSGLYAGSELGQPGVFKRQAPRFLRRWGSPFTPRGLLTTGSPGAQSEALNTSHRAAHRGPQEP